jgi:hypothetical protein
MSYFTDDWVVGDRIGPYIISNHFAGALALTVPALLAVWLAFSRERMPNSLRWVVVVAVTLTTLYAVWIKARSRAGTAAIVLALSMLTTLLTRPLWLRRSLAAITAAIAVAIIVIAASLYGLTPNLDSLFPASLRPSVRAILQDKRAFASHVALRMFMAAPLFGTGLNTYGGLYPRFTKDDQPWYFAHNDYAQFLAESGLFGLAAVGGLAAILTTLSIRSCRITPVSERLPQAGAWAAVAGIAAHSFFDWNMHVPANAFLTCLAMGITLSAIAGPSLARHAGRRRVIATVLFIMSLLVTTALLARDTAAERAGTELRRAIASARLSAGDPKKPLPFDGLKAAIACGESMAPYDQRDAKLAVLIGQAYLHAAAEQQPIDDANACLEAANAWFQKARRASAICRGLEIDE